MKSFYVFPLILIFAFNQLLYGQISTTMYAGPNNNGEDVIEICMSITNVSNINYTLFQGQEQIIVVQFGDAPINGDFTEEASCLRSDQFVVSDSSVSDLINPSSVSTVRSDRQDFEVAFSFTEDLALTPGEGLELFCGQNTNITGSCDNLVFLLDCSGTQFTIFNNGSIMPRGIGDCTQGFAQQCDPNRPNILKIDLLATPPSCPGSSDASLEVITEGGIAPFTFEWSNGQTTSEIFGISPNTYSVTVTDSLECMATMSLGIMSSPDIILSSDTEYSCQNESNGTARVQVIENGTSPFLYQWNDPMNQTTPKASNLSVGTYTVTVSDAKGCMKTADVQIENPPNNALEVFCSDMTNESITFSWTQDTLAMSYEVNVNDTEWLEANRETSHFLGDLEQDQSVSIAVRAIRRCSPYPKGSASCIAFIATKENSLFIPNVFSPNGDGINDLFIISTRTEAQVTHLTIFERYGGLVFTSTASNNEDLTWDGKKGGKDLNPQVFAYRVSVLFSDGRTETVVGDITLIR